MTAVTQQYTACPSLAAAALEASPFNIVIAGRAARTSTHDRRFRIRCLEAVLLCDHIEIGRGNVSTHVERAAPKRLYAEERIIDQPELLTCLHCGDLLVPWNSLAWDKI